VSSNGEDQARDRLLRTASELFYRNGILSTGVDALIEGAGVAKATFYRHFPSKDDLVVAWLRQPEARWLDWVVAELERRGGSPLQRLVGFWDVLGQWLEERNFIGCPFINTLVEIRDHRSPARREVESFIREVEDYLTESAAAAGLPDPAEQGRRMRYITMAVFVGSPLERSTRPIETARAQAIDLIALSLRTTPATIERRIAEGDA
jgi:AcrR family transcriptional regulator